MAPAVPEPGQPPADGTGTSPALSLGVGGSGGSSGDPLAGGTVRFALPDGTGPQAAVIAGQSTDGGFFLQGGGYVGPAWVTGWDGPPPAVLAPDLSNLPRVVVAGGPDSAMTATSTVPDAGTAPAGTGAAGTDTVGTVAADGSNPPNQSGADPGRSFWQQVQDVVTDPHTALGAASFVPSLPGAVASAADGVLYAAQGKWTDAAIALGAAAVGMVSDAGAARLAGKGLEAGAEALSAAGHVSQAAEAAGDLGKVASVAGDAGKVGEVAADTGKAAQAADDADRAAATTGPTISASQSSVLSQQVGTITYGAFDSLGRPTGVQAVITPEMIKSGSPASASIFPPGWSGNGSLFNEARGHLLEHFARWLRQP